MHSSDSSSLVMNMRTITCHLTLWDADRWWFWPSIIGQQKVVLRNELASLCHVSWPTHSISCTLYLMPSGIGKYAVLDVSKWYAQHSPVHLNFNQMWMKAAALLQISEPVSHTLAHILTNINTVFFAKLDSQICSDWLVIMLCAINFQSTWTAIIC